MKHVVKEAMIAKPIATAMTTPATVPFVSRWSDRIGKAVCEIVAGDSELLLIEVNAVVGDI